MEYTSQIRVESKACAGVVFTILAMGWKRRAALRKLQASTRARITGLRDEMAPLSKAYDAAVRAAKGAVQPARDQLLAEGKTAGEAEAAIPLGAVEFGALQTLMDLSAQVEEIDREELTPQAVRFCLVGTAGPRAALWGCATAVLWVAGWAASTACSWVVLWVAPWVGL